MEKQGYAKGFRPYGSAALLVGLVGGFSAVLGPAFVKDMGLAYNNATWTALATAVSSAALAPVLGKLGDALGRRYTLLGGVAVFGLGNALCAVANSLLLMLVARFVVGAGMAAIAPVVMAYILTEYPPQRIAKGFAMYMLLSSGSVVIGPTVGSWIIDTWGWRTMMWLCAGLCVAVLVYCLTIREKNVARQDALAGFDVGGAVLVLIFFSLLLCIPSFGQNIGWSSSVFRLTLLGAVVSLLGLVWTEKRARNPILPGAFLGRKAFILPVLALVLTQGLMQANMTNTIVFVEYTRPGDTVVSGYAISVMYIGMALGSIALGPLADKYEPKQVLTGSLAVTAAGVGMMLLFSQNTMAWLLMASLGILGFGLGANATIFMKVVLSGVGPEMAGAGTGTYGLFRDLAAPFGVAVLVPMFTNGVTNGITGGLVPADAAVEAIRKLAVVELVCAGLGIAVVQLLPKVHKKR